MTFDEQVVREQICDVCHKMWQLGWVATFYDTRHKFVRVLLEQICDV